MPWPAFCASDPGVRRNKKKEMVYFLGQYIQRANEIIGDRTKDEERYSVIGDAVEIVG